MAEKRSRFRIRVGEIEVEAEGEAKFVDGLRRYAEELVLGGGAHTATAKPITSRKRIEGPAVTLPTAVPTKPESIAELLERVPNKGHIDKIVAFGYHLEKNKKAPSFSVGDLNDCYSEAKEKPSNTAQFVAMATQRGLMMKAPDQPGGATRYVVTRKGEQKVEAALAGKVEPD